MAAKHRHDTSTNGPQARRRWRVPALLLTSAVIGTGITIGAAAPASAGTNIDVKLGGTGPLSSVCQAITGKVFALPGSTVSVLPSTTGLKLPVVANLLGSLNLANTKTIVKNAQNQVVATATAGRPAQLPATSATYSYTNVIDAQISLLNPLGIKIGTKNVTVPLLAAVPGANPNQPLTLVVKPDINGCGVEIQASVPVNIPVPSISVNVPGVGGVQVGSGSGGGSGSTAPTSGTTAPSSGTPAPGATGSTSVTNPYDYEAPDCTGPCAVVPKGGGGGGSVGGASDVTLGDLGDAPAGGSSSGGSGDASGDAAAIAAGANSLGDGSDQLAVDRAFTDARTGSTSLPGLPTSLTIAAIAALAGASVLWFARRRLARG